MSSDLMSNPLIATYEEAKSEPQRSRKWYEMRMGHLGMDQKRQMLKDAAGKDITVNVGGKDVVIPNAIFAQIVRELEMHISLLKDNPNMSLAARKAIIKGKAGFDSTGRLQFKREAASLYQIITPEGGRYVGLTQAEAKAEARQMAKGDAETIKRFGKVNSGRTAPGKFEVKPMDPAEEAAFRARSAKSGAGSMYLPAGQRLSEGYSDPLKPKFDAISKDITKLSQLEAERMSGGAPMGGVAGNFRRELDDLRYGTTAARLEKLHQQVLKEIQRVQKTPKWESTAPAMANPLVAAYEKAKE